MTVIGRQERSLTKLWEQGLPQLYNSTIMHGFPNLFMLAGPYTYLGHNSIIAMAET
jgi:cation diffusion facilitator CzcD-associated flavoprotein CzcO